MIHDPLCVIDPNPLAKECRTCELIAKVRTDERSHWNTPYWSVDYHRGYRQAVADTRESIARSIEEYDAEHHPKHSSQYACIRCDISSAYRNAVRIVRGSGG